MYWLKRNSLVIVASFLSGCFTTKFYSGAPPEGPEITHHQVFLIDGLVPISSPDGGECRYGISRAESEAGVGDFFISLGIGLVGGVLGGVACAAAQNDTNVDGLCAAAGFQFLPAIIGTRTTTYTCAAAPVQQPVSTIVVPGQPSYPPQYPQAPYQQPQYAPPQYQVPQYQSPQQYVPPVQQRTYSPGTVTTAPIPQERPQDQQVGDQRIVAIKIKGRPARVVTVERACEELDSESCTHLMRMKSGFTMFTKINGEDAEIHIRTAP